VYLLFVAIGVGSIPAWASSNPDVSPAQSALSAENHADLSPFHLLLIAEEEESEEESKQLAVPPNKSLVIDDQSIDRSLTPFFPPSLPIFAKKYLLFHCLKIFC
jgi:hypothetical protein